MEGGGNYRQKLGRLGEDLACEYLIGIGHTILERNLRIGHFEIDIVSYDSSGIHFVEVKTRKKSKQAPPQDAVDHTKQRKIAKAAGRYLKTRKGAAYGNQECSFDIVAVNLDSEPADIEWFQQAYIPIYL